MNKLEAIEWADNILEQGEPSDGCTAAPDFGFSHCCKRHDVMLRFNQGITARQADRYLRECIQDHGHPVLSWVYWAFVRYSNIVGDWRFATFLLFFFGVIVFGIAYGE